MTILNFAVVPTHLLTNFPISENETVSLQEIAVQNGKNIQPRTNIASDKMLIHLETIVGLPLIVVKTLLHLMATQPELGIEMLSREEVDELMKTPEWLEDVGEEGQGD